MTGTDVISVAVRCFVAVVLILIVIRLRGKLDAGPMLVMVPSLALSSVAGPLVIGVLAVLPESSELAAFFAYASLLSLIPGLLLRSA